MRPTAVPAPRSVPSAEQCARFSRDAVREETATPKSESEAEAEAERGGRDVEDKEYLFRLHHDQTTLALGMRLYIEQIARVGEEMRGFLETGFCASDASGNIEGRVRLEK